jgi:phi LC3 family holin
MKINWKVRLKNRLWVVAALSQLFILIEMALVGAHAVGLTDFKLTEEVKSGILVIVNAIFGLLATLGVVQDPTTQGIEDSTKAQSYSNPK